MREGLRGVGRVYIRNLIKRYIRQIEREKIILKAYTYRKIDKHHSILKIITDRPIDRQMYNKPTKYRVASLKEIDRYYKG